MTATPSRIETRRLLLRPFDAGDLDTFFDCCRNPALGDNAGWEPHASREESERYLNEIFIGRDGVWAIVLKSSGRLIGSVGLIDDPKRQNPRVRMTGYWIDEAHWGHGYAAEALHAALDYGFATLGLSAVSAYTYPENRRSRRTLEKCGFRLEGRLAMAGIRNDGSVCDDCCHIITEEEHAALRRNEDER